MYECYCVVKIEVLKMKIIIRKKVIEIFKKLIENKMK